MLIPFPLGLSANGLPKCSTATRLIMYVKHISLCIKSQLCNTVNSLYLKVKVYPKLLIAQSKFSSPRKFTLRYQQFEIKEVEMLFKIGNVSKIYSFFSFKKVL